ncbi:MAG: TrkH family potassium uptake protein [Bacillota bacterium]|nr:TrkH family potassium uptake protein [Bacillota bacterium]
MRLVVELIRKKKLTPVQVLAIGFASIIFLGAVLLALPISSKSGESTPFLNCLFTSTSAVCVTGLVVVDTGTYWNYFGKTVIMLLIEAGGLGFMSFATLVSLILGKKITFKERLVMQEALGTNTFGGLVRLTRYVLSFSFGIQFIGASLLATQFIPAYGVLKGIYYSIFHAVSAFCNAGFDLLGNFDSLTKVYNNYIIVLTIAFLIIIGGIGFTVWAELYSFRRLKKLSLHTKLVLTITSALIVIGAVLLFILEYNNLQTIAKMTLPDKILSSFFASVTPRTAGFNSISTSGMSHGGKFITVILMFIGGSPGSTAGGVKTTTLGVLIFTVISVVHGREDTEIFNKKIIKDIVYRAFAIIAAGLCIVACDVLILSVTEKMASLGAVLYEVTSAFGTVGLTLGLTPYLSIIGKIVIILTMYAGRVGPLTIAVALAKNKKVTGIKYPEEKIMVG